MKAFGSQSWRRGLLIRALIPGVACALLASTAGLMYTERATVTLSVVPTRLQVEGVVLASASHGVSFSTTRIAATVSESQSVTSGEETIPAKPAYGHVTFSCSPMTSCPNGYTVSAGTILDSTHGFAYRTLSSVTFPSCAPSSPVGISAMSVGSAGNAAVGTVVNGQLPSYIHVTNPWPVLGGTDASTVPLVEQANVDSAAKALTAKVTSELPSRLESQAAGLTFFSTGTPTFSTATSAHVGDHVSTFTVTVTGTQQAIAFSGKIAAGLLREALSHQVPAGYHLTSDQINPTYALEPASASADATVTGSAVGYMIPSFDVNALASGLRGQTPSNAETSLNRAIPGSSASIHMTPFNLPWLPLVSDHISVVVVVE